MDVNGTKFHLLFGLPDWASCAENGQILGEVWKDARPVDNVSPPLSPPLKTHKSNFYWNAENGELTLQPQLFQFGAAPKDNPPDLRNKRGAALDRYGNWYWIDEQGFKIKVLSSGSNKVSDFYPISENENPGQGINDFQPAEIESKTPETLCGLTVTEDHYLVAGMLEPKGLLVFDLYSAGEPRRILWQAETAFAPFDIAARVNGGAFVLDRDNKCYWTLDRGFNVVGNETAASVLASDDEFQPVDGSGKRKSFRNASSDAFAMQLSLDDPIAIEALPDDTVLILDRVRGKKFSVVYRYFKAQQLDELNMRAILPLVRESQKHDFVCRGYDIAFLYGGVEGTDRLYVASEEGNQAFAFNLRCRDGSFVSPPDNLPASVVAKSFELEPIPEYLPMRLFGGRGLIAGEGKVYFDFGERWLPLIEQRRRRYVESATLETWKLDSKEAGCVWHRLLIDGSIPPETSVEVWSRTAEEEQDLELANWSREPDFYLRRDGSELPFAGSRSSASKTNLNNGEGTWELLLQKAAGRWLQLKLTLSGSGQRTPRLSSLRIYYPRFSYLRNYLPAIYREDAQSSSFLERFLANTEGFYTTIEGRIAAAQILFEARSAPVEALDWLASWFGVALEPDWDEAKRRLFIKHAALFFQYRGTLRGLRMALRLAFDSCADERIFAATSRKDSFREPVQIVESFLTRRTQIAGSGSSSEHFGIRAVEETKQWKPEQGTDVLHSRYQKFLVGKAKTVEEKQELETQSSKFGLIKPETEKKAAGWQQFALEVLGFVPSGAAALERQRWQSFLSLQYKNIAALNQSHQSGYSDFKKIRLPRGSGENGAQKKDWQNFVRATLDNGESRTRRLWQDFLARRYRRVGSLNDLYNTDWSSFEFVSLFDELPERKTPLDDWYQFENVVVAMHRTAHRFTVMVPVSPQNKQQDAALQSSRLDLVKRIIELEKPAHTVFDVKFFWNLFRVGEVRLGSDTILGLGSRDPRLGPELIVGETFVGESRVGAEMPERTNSRYVLGSEVLKQK